MQKICPRCEKEKPLTRFYNSKTSKDGKRSYCIECEKERGREYDRNNRDKIYKTKAKWREKNPGYYKNKYKRRKKIKGKCVACGGETIGTRGKRFCSDKCEKQYRYNISRNLHARHIPVCLICRAPLDKNNRYCDNHKDIIYQSNSRNNRGNGNKRWIFLKSSAKCPMCGKMKLRKDFVRGQNDKLYYNCNECAIDDLRNNSGRLARYGVDINLSRDDFFDTLERFDNKCVYCGDKWEHKDHLIPLAKGGEHTRTNVVPSCAKCNSSKNAKPPHEFTSKENLFHIMHTLGVH